MLINTESCHFRRQARALVTLRGRVCQRDLFLPSTSTPGSSGPHPVPLFTASDHDDDRGLLLPDHPPEVINTFIPGT